MSIDPKGSIGQGGMLAVNILNFFSQYGPGQMIDVGIRMILDALHGLVNSIATGHGQGFNTYISGSEANQQAQLADVFNNGMYDSAAAQNPNLPQGPASGNFGNMDIQRMLQQYNDRNGAAAAG